MYCFETAELYVKLYSWYFMPPSLHKVLIHGADIISKSFLAIGFMSEEALEAGNKIFQKARLNNSRTCSRLPNNEDVLHKLLVWSDPLITSLRQDEKKKPRDLSIDAKQLLMAITGNDDDYDDIDSE